MIDIPELKAKRITAAQWKAANAEHERLTAETKAREKREAFAKVVAAANMLVDTFMEKLAGGANPWEKDLSKKWGEADLEVINAAAEDLRALGFQVTVENVTHTGPGGRGQGEETYTDPKRHTLRIYQP